MTAQTANRLTAGIATGVFLIISVLLASLSSHRSADTFLRRPSTFFTDPSGARALFLVMKQFLPATEQWRRPIHLLPPHGTNDAVGTVVMAGPVEPLALNEAEHLHRWLGGGGQLILLTASGWPLSHRKTSTELNSNEDTAAQPRETLLSRYAPALRWTEAGRLLTGRATGSSIPEGEITLGWRRSFADTGGAQVIASVDGVPLALELPIGRGRIVAIADPAMASNGVLRRSDNAVWLVSLTAGWTPGKVLFDEYHHGFGLKRGTMELARAFLMTPWGWCLLQVSFAGLLLLLARGRRFGRVKHTLVPSRSSPLELVEARAGVLQVAGAQQFAVDLIAQQVCQILGKPHGKTIDSADLAHELEQIARSSGAADRVAEFRALFLKARNGTRLSDREFIALGRAAGEITQGQKL
jgi:hypothetical protein